MESGDGLIIRLGIGMRRLRVEQLEQLCELAQRLGNGLIELTRRGKLQLRGFTSATVNAAQRELVALGLAELSPYDRRAALLVNPLTGLDPSCADLEPLATELESALSSHRDLQHLPDKFGVVLDSGGALRDIASDLRLTVSASRPEQALLSLGDAARHYRGPTRDAARALIDLALLLSRYAPGQRLRELMARESTFAFEHCLAGWERADAPRERSVVPAIGFQPAWLALGVPFGSADAGTWRLIAELAAARAGAIRITPWRSVVVPGVPEPDRCTLEHERLRVAGLLTEPADPLLRAAACSGAPACRSALGETRTVARELARTVLTRLGPRSRLHVSGCAKGCAFDGRSDITLVFDEEGCKLGLHQNVNETIRNEALTLEAARARLAGPRQAHEYERNGAAIYERSFALIRAEAELGRFSALEERIAVRMIHACGMVELAKDIEFSPDFSEAAARALRSGAPILCDSKMLPAGVTRARLPAGNEVLCYLDDARVPGIAAEHRTTRSAAAVTLWLERLEGAVVAIGNAPTALFRLLELLDETAARPAAVIGVPVGFVGAAESKEALLADSRVPRMIVRGRKGGSAMAVAAINALASESER